MKKTTTTTAAMKFAFELFVIAFLSVAAASSSVLAFAPASLFSAKLHTNTNTNSIVVDSKVGQRWLQLQASDSDICDDDDDAVASILNRFGVDIDASTVGDTRGFDLDYNDDDYWEREPYIDSRSNTISSKKAPAKATAAENDDRFDLPEVSGKSHSQLITWTCGGSVDRDSIEVVLVTQCSVDRLPNLQAQLALWTGKASIAVYLKPTDNKLEAYADILSTIKKAKTVARNNKSFDVAVTIVEGCKEEEPYPINYLRNVALLQAQRQHLKFSTSLDLSAALLVDVDFRPSSNLFEMLHTQSAANIIAKEGKVVMCPAFESITTATCPETITSLKELVDNGLAEGFHQSHFPQGHGPTRFDTFWEKALNCPTSSTSTNEDINDYFWKERYSIRHEELFEPYIVMASGDIPLCDERFQGYGLNKISHLASVAAVLKGGEYLVLPGVFLVAPTHERSESWGKIYGNAKSDENKRNKLALKNLFSDFMSNLREGRPPVVSENTLAMQQLVSKSIE